MKTTALMVVAALFTVSYTQAAEWSGFAAVDLRVFTEQAALPGQNSGAVDPTALLQPEFRQEWHAGADRVTAVPFGRYDSLDSHRSHWDLRELNWLHTDDGWNVRVGVGKVFWGVTESRHLVDIVNQTDFVEQINGEAVLGQPMLNLTMPSQYGNISLLYLPYFRERTFPSASGRLRFTIPVDTDHAQISGADQWHPDWAVRWSRTFGEWDIGLAHFRGLSREPRLVPNDVSRPTALIPIYDVISQTSVDVQGALGPWLLKLEAMTRSNPGPRFAAAVAGFEYTVYGLLNRGADVGLLLEYQYDGRQKFSMTQLTSTLPTPADHDLFVATRLSLNDEHNAQLLLGVTVDVVTQATLMTVKGSRRMGEHWKVEVESRGFYHIPSTDILAGMSQDDYVQIRLMRFF